MKNTVIRLFCISLSLMLMLSALSGCNEETRTVNTLKSNVYSEMEFNYGDVTEGLVCENDSFSLSWDNMYSQPIITDKKTGEKYSPMPQEAYTPKLDENGEEIFVSHWVKSSLVIYYEDAATLTEGSALSSSDVSGVYAESIENGVKVTYDFADKEISVAVRYTIHDDRFEITVDPKEVSDGGVNRLVGVAVAPFLCGIENDSEDSYLFYPDGSGAIITPDSRDLVGSQGSMRVYGDDLSVNVYALNTYTKQVNIPAFGVKKQDSAVLGIITSGAEQAYMNWDVGAENKGFSSVYPFFRIRGYDYISRPSVFLGNLPYIQVYDNYISESLMTVSYYVLNGNEADYNGMAKTYREYAVENGIIKKSDKQDLGASVEILGGLETKAYTLGIPYTTLTSVTTLNEAEEMVKYLTEKTDSKLLFNLVGFGQSGLDVGKVGGGFKIGSAFGSKKDAKALTEFAKKQNAEILMDFDIVAFNKGGNGFSKSKDMVTMLDNQTLYLKGFNDVTRNNNGKIRYLLLSRGKLADAVSKAVKVSEDYGFSGVTFNSLSQSSYSDYNVKGYGLSLGMAQQVNNLFTAAGKKGTVAASSANIYAAGISDYAMSVPTESSKLDVTAYDIPFYQMVLSGYVPMTSEAINLSLDSENAILKCIESGISPSFMLSYSYDSSIVTSQFTALSSTNFNGLKEDAVKYIEEINSITAKTKGQSIKNYTVLSDTLRVTEFENGVKIAVNYGNDTEKIGNTEIGAKEYKVLEG